MSSREKEFITGLERGAREGGRDKAVMIEICDMRTEGRNITEPDTAISPQSLC